MAEQFLITFLNIKFHENLFCHSELASCIQMDRLTNLMGTQWGRECT
jgi:hypothetical protein